ncbi:hypothetical protein [Agrococcus baldri]|uniref:Lipoprotein n=1 Tax=Agrococcus baldri TaxID=153730 RepID=A0AA87R8Y6_9MICO|nr:hypothetical protein [Agrococcus baldri]GEK78785.1 hypothetical protein ABA31_01360 [Agrococcus baldri]
MSRLTIGGVAALAIAVTVTGCAAAGTGSDDDAAPAAPIVTGAAAQAALAELPEPGPTTAVLAIGTVLEQGDGTILCLGAVAESAPPQCEGPELHEWDWERFEHQETGGVRWAQGVALEGLYESVGYAFFQTGEPMSAAAITLPAIEVPAGELDDATVEAVLADLSTLERVDVLGARGQDGIVVLDVIWDDGSMQQAIDAVYGDGVVFVASALRGAPEEPAATASGEVTVVTGPAAQARLAELPRPTPRSAVSGAGTVLERDEGDVLCVGDVGATAPPSCDGLPLIGFDWTVLESEEAQGTRWVTGVVSGTWDGEVFTVDAPPQPIDVWSPPAVDSAVTVSDEQLMEIQADLLTLDRGDFFGHGPMDGHYELQVLYDDGSIQAGFDDIYGTGVVQVLSSLRD